MLAEDEPPETLDVDTDIDPEETLWTLTPTCDVAVTATAECEAKAQGKTANHRAASKRTERTEKAPCEKISEREKRGKAKATSHSAKPVGYGFLNVLIAEAANGTEAE